MGWAWGGLREGRLRGRCAASSWLPAGWPPGGQAGDHGPSPALAAHHQARRVVAAQQQLGRRGRGRAESRNRGQGLTVPSGAHGAHQAMLACGGVSGRVGAGAWISEIGRVSSATDALSGRRERFGRFRGMPRRNEAGPTCAELHVWAETLVFPAPGASGSGRWLWSWILRLTFTASRGGQTRSLCARERAGLADCPSVWRTAACGRCSTAAGLCVAAPAGLLQPASAAGCYQRQYVLLVRGRSPHGAWGARRRRALACRCPHTAGRRGGRPGCCAGRASKCRADATCRR